MADILTNNIIIYALDQLIKSLENKDDDSSKLLKETANRAKELTKHLQINGADYIGLTFDEYLKKLNDKPNIYILSKEEAIEMATLKRFITILNNNGIEVIDTIIKP